MSIVRSQLRFENKESTDLETNKNLIEIDVVDVEISEINADAIVHYTNADLDLREDPDFNVPYSIGRTIIIRSDGKALNVLKNLAKNSKPLEIGQIAITESFGLNCKHIFHVAVKPLCQEKAAQKPYSEAKLFKAISTGIERSLKTAESMKLTSLAVPLLDRISHHFPIALVAEIYCNTLGQAIKNLQLDYLKHVLIVATQDQGALKIIRSYLSQRSLKQSDREHDTKAESQNSEPEIDDLELDLDLDFDIDAETDISHPPAVALKQGIYSLEQNDELDLSNLEMLLEEDDDRLNSNLISAKVIEKNAQEKGAIKVNLLPFRTERMKKIVSQTLFSKFSMLGTVTAAFFGLTAAKKKASFRDKAFTKEKKSISKCNRDVAAELSSEIKPDAEREKLKAELRAANLEIENLKEQLRIALGDLDKYYALKNIPCEEYRSAPLPIAFAHNMVESEIAPMLKMENLRRALGIALRYFASIVFADYHSLGCFSDEENKICREAFSRPVTDGTWFFAAEKIVRTYIERDKRPTLIKEIPNLWIDGRNKKTKFNGLCSDLVKLRNDIHGKVSIDETTARDWLERALPKWDAMLKEALPLCKYRLFYLEGIDDFGENGEILYHLKWIMGEHLVPRSERVQWRKKLRKGKLYLWDPETADSMDLTPFMAYEYNDITKTRETYCIEQIIKGRLTFATLRFPDKAELPNHQQKIFTRETNTYESIVKWP